MAGGANGKAFASDGYARTVPVPWRDGVWTGSTSSGKDRAERPSDIGDGGGSAVRGGRCPAHGAGLFAVVAVEHRRLLGVGQRT